MSLTPSPPSPTPTRATDRLPRSSRCRLRGEPRPVRSLNAYPGCPSNAGVKAGGYLSTYECAPLATVDDLRAALKAASKPERGASKSSSVAAPSVSNLDSAPAAWFDRPFFRAMHPEARGRMRIWRHEDDVTICAREPFAPDSEAIVVPARPLGTENRHPRW